MVREYICPKDLNHQIFECLGNRVRNGPFQGMYVSEEADCGGGYSGLKLLGCYEYELHPFINKAIQRNPSHIVNIGCAEGYYAIGLALALPHSTVYAIDINDDVLILCKTMADKNDCTNRVITSKSFDPSKTELMIVDCEACELDLLTETMIQQLSHCDVIVECHDFMKENITNTLKERFQKTHDVELIPPVRIDWTINTGKQTFIIEEYRPSPMAWLACWSHK